MQKQHSPALKTITMYKVIKLTTKGMLVAKTSSNKYQMGNEAIGYASNPDNLQLGAFIPDFSPTGLRTQAGVSKDGVAIELSFWVF